MTIHFHHSSGIANAMIKVLSRRPVSLPVDMDRRIFADIGFSQSDIIALRTR